GSSSCSASCGSTIAQIITNNSGNVGTVTYTITPSASSCVGPTTSATITVNPKPVAVATPSTASICSGNAPSIALTSNVTGTLFAWAISQTATVSGGSACNSTCGTTITQALANSSNN